MPKPQHRRKAKRTVKFYNLFKKGKGLILGANYGNLLLSINKAVAKVIAPPLQSMLSNARHTTLAAIILGLSLIALYHLYYAHRIIPGVSVGTMEIGGLTYNEAKNKLGTYESSLDKKLILTHNGTEFVITAQEINLEYFWDASVTRAFEIGRTGNFLWDTKEKIAGFIGRPLTFKAFYDFEDDELSKNLLRLRGELNTPAEDAYFILARTHDEEGVEQEESTIKIVADREGFLIHGKKMHQMVVESLDNFDFSPKKIPTMEDEPELTKRDLEEVSAQVEKVVLNPLEITYQEESWTMNPEKILDFVKVKKVTGTKLGGGDKIEIDLETSSFEPCMEGIAQEIDLLPKGEVVETDGDTVTEFKLVEEGLEVDTKKFAQDFKKALLEVQPSVEIPTKIVTLEEDADKYGILALLGEGTSKYIGSSQARVSNLTLAASRVSGVLVAPGETFSFNRAVGAIEAETGYDTAWIISNGRTVRGTGGGVCQTSTTLFRAILNSGLPVVTRHPHAYRVYYYEQDAPIGFDASVYQPTLDLRFKNDTAHYVLVQASWDLNNYSLTFKLYGTPDGREVEISDPVVTNLTAAPAPLYQDDPTLAKGVVKQIDFSAGGASASFTRTVSRNDEVLYNDTFRSWYRPWRAIFLVGTKEML